MDDCIFCRIISGKLPSKKVLETDKVLVFEDINPKAPKHVLIVPKKHITSLQKIEKEDTNLLGELLYSAKQAAVKMNINESGFKIVINNGKDSGQIVFHLHLHLIGGWKKVPHWDV